MKVVHLFSIWNSKKQTGLVGVRPPPRLSLLEKLNLLRSRNSTNPGPILRGPPRVVRALTHALIPPHM
jgi:hypothetical protein